MKIVILAAGKGERFGGEVPKPLIKFNGRTMLEWVISDIGAAGGINKENLIVVTQKAFNIKGDFTTIELNGFTEGPACTAMKAMDMVRFDEELIIVNCDQRMLCFSPNELTLFSKINGLSGIIGVFHSHKHHNSYVNIDQDNLIAYVKEKRVISNLATNGLHYWKYAQLFESSCSRMIKNNDRVNGEFYISQTYNYLIKDGHRIGPYYFNFHYPIGIPEDLANFVKMGI